VAMILEDVLGRQILYLDTSEKDVRSLLSYYAWDPEVIDHILGLFKYVRAGAAAAVTPTLGALLGRAPTTFAEFARDHAAVWR